VNSGFTVSGLAGDVPVSYDEGKRLIRRRAITVIRAEAGNSLDAAK